MESSRSVPAAVPAREPGGVSTALDGAGRDEGIGREAELSPLIEAEGPTRKRLPRIVRGVLVECVLFVLLSVLSPLLFGCAAVVDGVLWVHRRKPWMGTRIVFLCWWFLFGELCGLAGVFGVWVLAGGPRSRDSATRRRRIYRLQVAWAAGLVGGLCRVCRVRFVVEENELVGPGPVIVFARHVSVIDNGLPAMFVSRPNGLDLRYVLKSQLQALPGLDIGARWVPTCFVRRGSSDSAGQIERVRTLAKGLAGKRDGVLVYPEGTRFTRRKLAALRADAGSEARAAQLSRLRHLLPPQPGGALALLEEAPHAAVVVCGHVGLDDFHGLRDLWDGRIIGRCVRIRFWRHERAELPAGRNELAAWLFDRWQDLDDWIEQQRYQPPARATASPA